MTKTKQQMGRPTTHIDRVTLARLRKEEGFSQLSLAKAVYERAGKNWASKKSLNTTAQRWESKGNISATLLVHLAAVLKTSAEVLTGNQPVHAPSRQDEIEALLKVRVADQGNTLLQKRLSQVLRYERDNPLKYLAGDVSREIEVAQLSRSRDELDQLSAITGLDTTELMRPLSQQGLWLLVSSGPHGIPRQELFYGFLDLQQAIKQELSEQSQIFPTHDSEIRFTEEGLWFNASWTHFVHEGLRRVLKFVRCQATEKGLTWVAPSTLDRLFLSDLRGIAYQNFSTVTWFEETPVPSNPSQLRIVIKKYLALDETAKLKGCLDTATLFEHAGSLLDMPPAYAEHYAKSGQANYFAIESLSRRLWERLEPYLSEVPLRYWSLREGQSGIDVLLMDAPIQLRNPAANPLQLGMRFSIELTELLPDGVYRTAPWKAAALRLIYSELEKAFNAATIATKRPITDS